MARVGKIQSLTAAQAGNIATPDNSNFVFIWFESDSDKLVVKQSDASLLRTAALT